MRLLVFSVLLVASVLLAARVSAQTIHYVDHEAAGAGDGRSWTGAYTSLQDALNQARAGDEIWVARGVYRPTLTTDRSATFQLRAGVALYGGFAGSEAHRDARDWKQHETVLSGDIGVVGNDEDNSYHVVSATQVDSTSVLDGFIVTGAYADGAYPHNRGGGMRNIAASPTVRHCVFRANQTHRNEYAGFGAGMFNDQGSSPTLTNVRFERNRSEGAGGGMSNREGSHPKLRRVVFLENEATQLGGGMTNDRGASPTLIDVRFVRNRSEKWTGGMDNYQESKAKLFNVSFLGNVAGMYGGGMTADAGSDVLLVNAQFVGNVAHGTEPGAAGLQSNGSQPTLVGVAFVANQAAQGAGAIGLRDSGAVRIHNSILWGNGTEIQDEIDGQRLLADRTMIQGARPEDIGIAPADPRFVRSPSPGEDGTWGTPDDDYGDLRLRADSPALDAGSSALLPADVEDIDGDGDRTESVPTDLHAAPRVVHAGPDLGPFEGAVSPPRGP